MVTFDFASKLGAKQLRNGQILNAYVKNLQRGEQDNIRVDDTMN